MKDIKLRYEALNKEHISTLLKNNEQRVVDAYNKLINKSGKGCEFTGWVNYPLDLTDYDIASIKKTVSNLKAKGQYLVVIGIGGSFLGSKAFIDMLTSYHESSKIIYMGNNISPKYLHDTLAFLENVDFTCNVISKSGKTLEPSLAFRYVKDLLIKKYNANYNEHIVVTSSKENSLLIDEAKENNYQTFYIPNDVGGRYSVFTPVGLIPICFSGFDIVEFIKGAINAYTDCTTLPYKENNCLLYASLRNILYESEKTIEALVSYEPNARNFGEWWKQLFGESEGKMNKGIFPVSLIYSTDLHSLGQYVQDGIRNIFETVITVKNDKVDLTVNEDIQNIDKLNYLKGKSISYIKKQINEGVVKAHVSGDVANIILEIDEINEYNLGYLMYFFMFACGVSGYILDVNPFNQEGVEEYKKNMFTLLKK